MTTPELEGGFSPEYVKKLEQLVKKNPNFFSDLRKAFPGYKPSAVKWERVHSLAGLFRK